MIDFTRGEGSKNHKNSFEKAIKSVNEYLESLHNDYLDTWNKLEAVRKERAAIIENMIKYIKDNKLKVEIPLGRCNNDQINSQMKELISTLSAPEKKKLQIELNRMNELYSEIYKIAPELERFAILLSDIRLKEADYEDEVIFVPKSTKKTKEKNDYTVKNDYPSIIETADLIIDPQSIQKDTDMSNTLSEEIEAIISSPVTSSNEPTIEITEETDEYIPYTLKNGITFIEITENVYGNADLWSDLYRYESNKEVISRRAKECGVDVETAVKSPSILENVTLLLPTELTYIEK